MGKGKVKLKMVFYLRKSYFHYSRITWVATYVWRCWR